MTIIGYNGSGSSSSGLTATSSSALNVLHGAVLPPNQKGKAIWIRIAGDNTLNAGVTIPVVLYDAADGQKIISNVVLTMPASSATEWISFPWTPDLTAHAGKTLRVGRGKPSSSYTIRRLTGLAGGDGQANSADLPSPWSGSDTATVDCLYFETEDAIAQPTLSGTLVIDNEDTAYTGQVEFTITAATTQGGASMLTADSTVTPAADGAWSFSDGQNLPPQTRLFVNLYWEDPEDPAINLAWSGYLTTSA